MSTAVWLFALIGVGTLAACQTPLATPEPLLGASVDLHRVRAESYSFAYYTGMRRNTDRVVETRSEWSALRKRICGACEDPLGELDFRRQRVIVSALGQRNSGGFSILLES